MSERIEKLRICNRKGIHTCRLGSIHLNEREAGILTEYLTQLEAERDEAVRRAVEGAKKDALYIAQDVFGDIDDFWEKMDEYERALTPPHSDISSEGNSK